MLVNNIQFIEQSVIALPSHDPNGDIAGTAVDVDFAMREDEETSGRYLASLRVSADIEESGNPPYDFTMHAMVSGQPQEDDLDLFRKAVFQMLVGATRERLASLTSRAPWDDFHLGLMSYQQVVPEEKPSED